MNYYERALALKEETIAHRRFFHANAEVGLNTPRGRAYVLEELKKLGIDAQPCGHGVSATVGKGGKCLLLRADMDALPMAEESGLDFACPTGAEAHTCGHDFHAAMLLTAAKILKENEASLCGTVKLMFQPGEETFEGARDMIENGILSDPRPDGALAFHVAAGRTPVGVYMYNAEGTMMFSVNGFTITVNGKGAHGAYPHVSVDPIHIGAHIFLALEGLIAREVNPAKATALTVGAFQAGSAANIIPDTAVLEGTIRSNDKASQELLVKRVREVAEKTAAVYGGSARVELTTGVPPLACDPELTRAMAGYIAAMNIPGAIPYAGICASASEDFAVIAEAVPSAYLYLSAGYPDARGDAPAHNPKVQFNEDVCPMGAACYAHCAAQWLKDNK